MTQRRIERTDVGVDGDEPWVDTWVEHFRTNRESHAALEARADWAAESTLSRRDQAALVHSLQRFELGEGGDGEHLLRKAERRASPARVEALRLLIAEEQAHSALFARGLRYFGAPRLGSHWSDAAFTRLRRALGLRTELMLFLVAETVAMPYFVALSRFEGDEVVRTIGLRIALDEGHHIAFQVDQLRHGFRELSGGLRTVVFAASWVIAVGAATVVAVDHGPALRASGMSRRRFWRSALNSFRVAVASALWPSAARLRDQLTVRPR